MVKKKQPPVSVEEARRGIYIDFEGTMKDPASFLGVLVVGDGGATEFDQPVFEEDLWPVVRHHKPKKPAGYAPRAAEFFETFVALREQAESESRKVFAYSTREITEIKKRIQLRREVQWWEENLLNARPYAKAWKKDHHNDVEFKKNKNKPMSGKYTLDQFFKLIGYEVPSPLRSGNTGQRIRHVRDMLNKYGGNYGALTPTAKGKWTKVCLHNWHDCEGMRELMVRCARDVP